MVEWFGLEGTFQGRLVKPPCNDQGHLQLDQAAQSPSLEHFQGGGTDNLSGQPGPGFHHPQSRVGSNGRFVMFYTSLSYIVSD